MKKKIINILNTIYDMGDKDECSIKHIYHTLAAIKSCQYNSLDDLKDYSLPFGRKSTLEENWEISGKWDSLLQIMDEKGMSKVFKIIDDSNYSFYESYLHFYDSNYEDVDVDGDKYMEEEEKFECPDCKDERIQAQILMVIEL